jgi:hypothetical protein
MKAQMTFRVFTRTGTKCIRKFNSLDDAKHYTYVHENAYRIEWTEPACKVGGCYVRERHNRVFVNC